MEQCHIGYNLLSSVINDNSTGKLSEVPLKTSSTKSYLSLVSFFFLPTFEQFGVNSICKSASTPRLKSYTIALRYLNQKLFACIFDQRLLFDYRQLCIWPLKLPEHYELGNHGKNQRLRPLQNSLNVSCTIHDFHNGRRRAGLGLISAWKRGQWGHAWFEL